MVILASLLAMSSAAPVSVEDIVTTAEISGVSISPDEQWVAYRVSRASIETNRVDLAWLVVPAKGGIARRVADGGEARFDFAGVIEEDAPVWDADSRGFHFLARREGATSIWSWREGPPAITVTDAANILGFRASEDGSELVYSVGASRDAIAAAEREAYENGVLVDRGVDLMQPVAGGAIVDGKRVMQRLPGPWFERARLLFDAPRVEKRIALARRAANGPEGRIAPSGPALLRSAASTSGAKAEIRKRGSEHFVKITAPDGSSTDCHQGACASPRLRSIAWRPGRNELLLFEAGTGSAENIWRLGRPNAAPRLIAVTDGAPPSATRPPRCAVASTFVACASASALDPPTLVRIDLETGDRAIIADPNPELRARIQSRATPLEWRDADGVVFTGVLLSPARRSPQAPLVIQYYHCDGFLKGGVGDELPMIPLTEAGIKLLCIRKARAPEDQPTDREYDLALSGIGAAIDLLASDGEIDPRRVGIGGLSFGSQVALWAVRKSKRFAAATLSSGQFEPYFYWAYALTGSGIPDMLQTYWKLGDPDDDREGWRRLSAMSDIGTLDTPLLMQLPESEARTVVEFHTRMKRAGKPVDLFVFPDEPHIKTQPVHQYAANARNLDWYRYWLLGLEDPAPSKARQYARWRTYRAGQSLPAPAP